MSDNSPVPSSAVQLVPEAKKSTDLCIICQHKKDTWRWIKLTGTPDGRNIIIQTSELLQDGPLISLSDCDLAKIKYHFKTCYARYKRSGKRHTQMQNSSKREATTEWHLASPTNRQNRAKTGANPSSKEKSCIICGQIICEGDTKSLQQKRYLKQLSVYTRCILFKCIDDVYAADVMYHNKCLNSYIKKF